MTETYIVLALFLVMLVLSEVEKRRAVARETELLKIIKNLQNRISAKDLAGYLALEQNERPAEPMQPPRSVSPEDMFDAMNYGSVNGQ